MLPYAKASFWNVSINVFAVGICEDCFKTRYRNAEDPQKGWESWIKKTYEQFECKLFPLIISSPNPTVNEEKWCDYANNSNWIAQKDGSEIEVCGSVNGVAEEHSRIAMKHFSNSSIEKRRTAEIMGRRASSLATFGISLCSLYLKCSKPVLQAQPPHPLWFDIIGMLSFTLFACAASVMLLVEARFTHIQITVMLIAFFALVLA